MPDNTLVHIQYLYFLRRCKSKEAARSFFIKTITANQNKFWQLYVAMGDIEENVNNDTACAQRIFQNGFKYFKEKPEFVVCYAQFLMNKKDANSKNILKEIFETILPGLDPKNKETQKIWKLYIKFQQRLSDLNLLHQVEEKRNNEQHCNRIEKLLHSIDRFTYLDLLPVSKQYRDTLIHAKQTSQRKVSQKLNAIQTNILNHHNNTNINNHYIQNRLQRIKKKRASSRIKINAFSMNDDIENQENSNNNNNNNDSDMNTPFVDMTTFIDDTNLANISNKNQDSNSITMPDLGQLSAFRPGIRFLQNLNDDEDDDEEDEEDDDDEEDEDDDIMNQLKESLPPKLKELLLKLPPPQHTQLLKLDKHTTMIDIDSFLTMMKLKLHDDIL